MVYICCLAVSELAADINISILVYASSLFELCSVVFDLDLLIRA
jgi:hypothetical protein